LPNFTGNRVLLVNKDDSNETRFQIGTLGVKRSNPDYVPIQVINTILGGRFTSWLNDELRVNAGLTYGARSFFRFMKDSGTFSMYSFTKTSTTIECIDLALKVLDRLHKEGIDQKTLDSAKKYIQGQFPPRYETSGRLAALLTSMFVYNFNESFIDTFQKTVEGMTLAKAKEIIAKYFPKDKLQFLLIGKASEIKEKIKKYGPVSVKEIKADGF
jgi:predicted Zn-dependent peptidase